MAIENKIKLVFKGILLYTTLHNMYTLQQMGIDNIYDQGYLFIDVVICAGLIYACYKTTKMKQS
nr:MAG TPA: hypothetical protein [Bacteriophage sp.]